MKELRGVGVALVTPFTKEGEVDFGGLTKLLEQTSQCDYYVVLGTTGESVTLSVQERAAVVRHVVGFNRGVRPIVMGVGGNNTAEVVRQLSELDLEGVDAILSVVPYYNKPSQEGIYAHYAEVLKNSPLPVVLYNVPGRTGVNMSAGTTLRLASDFPKKAVAVKEASGNLSQVAYILRDRPEGFLVISGDDNMTLPLLMFGGDGVISVSANCFTEKMCQMVHAALDGDNRVARERSLELFEATDLLFKEGNPVGAKAALEIKGVGTATVRLPLVEASDSLKSELKNNMEKWKL
ncbi:MAG: 4-hydroxy-tetrahydrodipicolinate synthase [Rikenellaceae bacterium]